MTTRLRTLLGALLLTTALPAALPTAPAQAGASETVPFRIGSYNIEANRDMQTFKEAVNAFKPHVDVAGLQEIAGHVRNAWLDSDEEWRVYHAADHGQNPVIWDPEVFEVISARDALLAERAQIEDRSGKPIWKQTTYAPVVRLRHVATGQRISVINLHLLQGVVNVGRPDPKRPLAVRYYRKQVASTLQVVAEEKADGFHPFPVGDYNISFAADRVERVKGFPYRSLTRKGMAGVWEDVRLKAHGTHIDPDCPPGKKQCGAYIDQIWADMPAVTGQVLTSIVKSDHYPIVGTYALPPIAEGYTPPHGTIGFEDADVVQSKAEGNGLKRNWDFVFKVSGDLAHGFARLHFGGTAERGRTYKEGDYLVDFHELYDADPSSPARIYIDIQSDRKVEEDETIEISLVEPPYNTVITAGAGAMAAVIANDDY